MHNMKLVTERGITASLVEQIAQEFWSLHDAFAAFDDSIGEIVTDLRETDDCVSEQLIEMYLAARQEFMPLDVGYEIMLNEIANSYISDVDRNSVSWAIQAATMIGSFQACAERGAACIEDQIDLLQVNCGKRGSAECVPPDSASLRRAVYTYVLSLAEDTLFSSDGNCKRSTNHYSHTSRPRPLKAVASGNRSLPTTADLFFV